MSRPRTAWFCGECGHKQAKWSGQCPQCQGWNCLHEEAELTPGQMRYDRPSQRAAQAVRLSEVKLSEEARQTTEIAEFDRLIGGGLIQGSLSLIGGDPGIGKSTLLLQVANACAQKGSKVLYVCGEESVEQTYSRAERLSISHPEIYFLSETDLALIKNQIDALQPTLLIIDSIQIIFKGEIPSAPGSVSQVRECAAELMRIAKGRSLTTFLVGHVTKSGEIAGPRVLEHLVDTVLYFEGDKQHDFRMVRVVKNRFGPTDEIAVFRMSGHGLQEVANPSELFIEERQKGGVGSAIIPMVEGTRPILIEVQALVTDTAFPTPSRRSMGVDSNRLALLVAVMEKRLGFRLHTSDLFVSVAGGMRISEPSVDLGVVAAIASSFSNRQLSPQAVAVGEVGLAGEIRSVPRIEARVKESLRMGFTRCIIPERNLKGVSKEVREQIEIVGVDHVEAAIDALLH